MQLQAVRSQRLRPAAYRFLLVFTHRRHYIFAFGSTGGSAVGVHFSLHVTATEEWPGCWNGSTHPLYWLIFGVGRLRCWVNAERRSRPVPWAKLVPATVYRFPYLRETACALRTPRINFVNAYTASGFPEKLCTFYKSYNRSVNNSTRPTPLSRPNKPKPPPRAVCERRVNACLDA
jgi:hypothetical protein